MRTKRGERFFCPFASIFILSVEADIKFKLVGLWQTEQKYQNRVLSLYQGPSAGSLPVLYNVWSKALMKITILRGVYAIEGQEGIASPSQNAGAPTPRAVRAAAAGGGGVDASAARGFRIRVCVAVPPPATRFRRSPKMWGPREHSAAPHSGGGAVVLILTGTNLPDAPTIRGGGGAGQAGAGSLLVTSLTLIYGFDALCCALWMK